MPKTKKVVKPTVPIKEIVVGSKTVGEWDNEWVRLDGGFTVVQTVVNNKVGLFRAVYQERTMAIGQACEYANGGLRKRISDFRRPSDSSRNGFMGQYLNETINELELYVLCIGDDEEAAALTKQLKPYMVKLYNPPKNASDVAIARAIAEQRRQKETSLKRRN